MPATDGRAARLERSATGGSPTTSWPSSTLSHKPLVGFSDGGQVALEIGMRYPTFPQSIAIGGVVSKYSDALRAFIRRAVGDERSPEADTELLARNHPGWAAWLDELYGPGGWKPLLARLKLMWTTPLTYTAADFAAVVAPTLLLVGDRDESFRSRRAEMYVSSAVRAPWSRRRPRCLP
jgi:pimeloyl-ACP methyl ester carboxylesterase